jgi:hypothetical protein
MTKRSRFAGTAPPAPPNATTTDFEGVLPEIHAVIDGVAGKVLVDSIAPH